MNNKELNKRLAGYSALAASLVTASNAGASVNFFSAGNTVLNSHGAFYNIDFDQIGGDGNDILISCATSLSGAIFYVQNFDAGQGGALLGPNPYPPIMYPFVLNGNGSVPVTGAWNLNVYGGGTLDVFTGYAGFWDGSVNKYMGVRFDIIGQTHYGFVKMSINNGSATIHSFGYETTPNTGISNIDEALPVGLSTLSAESELGGVNLQWTTESETDNLGFTIERQLAGETEWTLLSSYQTNADLEGQGSKTSRTDYEYFDNSVAFNHIYRYRLSDVCVNGNVVSNRIVEVTFTDTQLPDHTGLLAAYPNPFNPGTTIQYQIKDDVQVALDVIDITGRTVRSIVNEQQSAGSYSFAWDGNDNGGNATPSGVYMLVLRAGNITRTQKVTRLR